MQFLQIIVSPTSKKSTTKTLAGEAILGQSLKVPKTLDMSTPHRFPKAHFTIIPYLPTFFHVPTKSNMKHYLRCSRFSLSWHLYEPTQAPTTYYVFFFMKLCYILRSHTTIEAILGQSLKCSRYSTRQHLTHSREHRFKILPNIPDEPIDEEIKSAGKTRK